MIDWSTSNGVPVAALFENLEDGASVQQFVGWLPSVKLEQARVVPEHAARNALAPGCSRHGLGRDRRL